MPAHPVAPYSLAIRAHIRCARRSQEVRMKSQSQPAAAKGALGVIFFVLLMDVIGLTILFPVAPYIVRKYSPNALMVTLLSVIYAGAQFVAAPALGRISDRTGRRPVLLVSVLGSAVGYLIF